MVALIWQTYRGTPHKTFGFAGSSPHGTYEKDYRSIDIWQLDHWTSKSDGRFNSCF